MPLFTFPLLSGTWYLIRVYTGTNVLSINGMPTDNVQLKPPSATTHSQAVRNKQKKTKGTEVTRDIYQLLIPHNTACGRKHEHNYS